MTALLLTEPEAAEALKVCTRTLRKARREGLLKYVLIGRAVRYAPSDLEQFIQTARQDNPVRPEPVVHRRSIRRSNNKIIPFSAR